MNCRTIYPMEAKSENVVYDMRRMSLQRICVRLVLWGLIVGVALVSRAQVPEYKGFVNDYTDLLTTQQTRELEQFLTQYAESSSNEIAVIIADLPPGETPSNYTYEVGETWGVGGKENSNGIVVGLYLNERRVWISVGYGLEGVVPDIVAGNVIDKDMLPQFRSGNYYEGLARGVQTLSVLAEGEYPDAIRRRYYEGPSRPEYVEDPGAGSIMFLIILIIFIFIFLSRIGGGGDDDDFRGPGRRGRGYYRGGPYWWGTGGSWTSGSGGGSSWGGGSWGGGGFGGGGFGGFGGGSFGGGGAGGGW